MNRRIRQYIGIFAAVAAYYIVHEGAHLITALHYGVFKQIHVMGLGSLSNIIRIRFSAPWSP